MNDIVTTAAAATAAFFVAWDGVKIRAFLELDGKDGFTTAFPDKAPITTAEGIAEDNEITLASIVEAYNKIAPKKVAGFKDRKIGSAALAEKLTEVAASMKAAPAAGSSETEKLASALKTKKPAKEKANKAAAEGRSSPLSNKFYARSGAALNGRRIGGTGVGINALQYIIANPGCTTEEYLTKSGGGRYVDLQYDLDKGNIVFLTGATPEERAAEIAALDAARVSAEAVAGEKAKAEEEAKAKKKAEKDAADLEKKTKADADKKAKEDKKIADKAAADEKAAADKAASEAAVAADKAAADKKAK
jgi:hypothetical protein